MPVTIKKVSLRHQAELARQKKYLARLPEKFEYPLFNSRQAIESQRRSGYRNTAAAAREIVDNAIEAGATKVHIVFDTRGRDQRQKYERAEAVTAVAFIDNGSGMLPQMARYALSWGGGTHFNDHTFLGKFGFGLPNASINQTSRVEVYTRTQGEDKFASTYLDIADYAEHGLQTIKPVVYKRLPDFVAEYLDKIGEPLKHGTVVVWQKPDRLTYRMAPPLKEHLRDDFGVTYRYLLKNFELVVAGSEVVPVDPLFLTPGMLYYVEGSEGAQRTYDEEIPVMYYKEEETGSRHLVKMGAKNDLTREGREVLATGNLNIKVSRFPPGFAVYKEGKGERTDANRRWDIRKTRRGMSFVRSDREIDTVDAFPRSPRDKANGLGDWPLLQGYAYHWAIEVRFSPTLDEALGITNDKQSVRPSEDFWRVLTEEGIDRLLREENRWQVKQRKKRVKPKVTDEATPAERAAQAAELATGRKRMVPDIYAAASETALQRKAEEVSKTTHQPLPEVLKALKKQAERRPFLVEYDENQHAPFFTPEYVGTQIVARVNRAHPFYEALYGELLKDGVSEQAKEAVNLLILALARGELMAEVDEIQDWYETQRTDVWSTFLRDGMKLLSREMTPSEEEDSADADEEAA
jgi:hypothetical protein